VSSPYGGPQDRVGPPPGVLPPPQAAPWQGQYSGPPQGQPQGQQYPPPGQWAQPYYGPPGGQFNGFQPPKRRGGGVRVIVFSIAVLMFLGVSLVVIVALLGRGSDTTADPGVTGPSIVPTATTKPQQGTAEDFLLNASIYRTGPLPVQNCKAENLGNGSLASQKVYYQKLFACLNEAWRPIFKELGQDKPDPGLVVFDKPVQTPCGNFAPLSGRVLAFY
jgi:predicted metalloprotease